MGGKPIVAMNIVCFPACHDMSVLAEILKGGFNKVKESGALLVGGHTVDDKEPKYGLSVSGIVHPKKVLSNATAKEGDKLILTKPIGVGILNTAMKENLVSKEVSDKVIEVMDSVKDTDFPRCLVIDMFEYYDENGEVQIDVLECNPFVASGTYLYNSVFARKGYLNHIPMDGSMDPYKTIPDEKLKYGPVEMYSKDSTIKGRPSICYELPGGFAADIISFSMFGKPSNGMFLHFETSRNLDPTNIGPIDLSMSMIDSDEGLESSHEDEDVDVATLIKRLRESKRVSSEAEAEED